MTRYKIHSEMEVRFNNYYDILRVERDAPPESIRTAYRRLAQKYHPDKAPGDANAARVMTAINTAYQVLSDSAQRASHDSWIAAAKPRPVRAPIAEKTAAWPWYLLFATMAFALATVGIVVYKSVVPSPVAFAAQAAKAPAARR
ncbi:MAG: J domain-containing protein [Burkholderiales bacterium]|nr:J domain-containing protein [Burkholderiales bacterium]